MAVVPSQSAAAPAARGDSPARRLRSWLSRFKQLTPFKREKLPRAGGDPAAQAPHKKRRRRILVAVVAALLAYPVLGTLALWTGFAEWALRSEDLRIEISNPAYTIWPGRIHAKYLRLLVNGETQFSLEGHDLVVNVRVLPLVQRRVHVTKLAAHGVRYQMRVQVEDAKGQEERIAAYPPLKDLPGAKVIREEDAQKTEDSGGSFTVQAEGLDISVQELWFFEYRYLGDGRLRGGFMVGPQVMQVTTAVQELGPGELRFGAEQTIAKNFRGHISANIPKVNPEEHADTSFFELVDARITLRADLQSLAHVSAYLDGLEVSRGNGPLALDLFLDKGLLGTKSRLDYDTQSIRVMGNGFGVETDWRVEFDAAGEGKKAEASKRDPKQAAADAGSVAPLLRSTARSTYASLSRGNRELTIQIHGHEEEAALDTIRLSGSTKLKRASVRMPNIVSVDLDDLGALLPEGTPFEVQGGEARASVSLDMDENYWVRGPINAVLDKAKMNLAGVRISGTTTLRAQARVNPKLKTNMLESVVLSMRDMGMHVGDEHVEGWWMDMTSPRLAMWNTEPLRSEATVSVRTRDLEPVLEALAEKDVLNDLIAKFTSLDDFRCKMTLRKLGPATDITLESESDVWDASGRIFMNGNDNRMALVVGGQAVSVGIANLGDGVEIMPFAKTGWLNDRLKQFPKPIVQMPASKP